MARAAGQERSRRGAAGRWLRRLAFIVAGLICLPLVLVPVYALVNPPITTLMLGDLATGRGYERSWVDLEDIGTPIIASVVTSEDAKFCRHLGVDFGELKAVIERYLDGEETRGASTIAMQSAKNLFLWPQRSEIRKAIEIPLALYMDLVWSKRRMLEIYLNSVEWAPGVYGIGEAARHHFNAAPDELSWRNAALLATTLPNPHVRDPARPSGRHAQLARTIERRARASGDLITCVQDN